MKNCTCICIQYIHIFIYSFEYHIPLSIYSMIKRNRKFKKKVHSEFFLPELQSAYKWNFGYMNLRRRSYRQLLSTLRVIRKNINNLLWEAIKFGFLPTLMNEFQSAFVILSNFIMSSELHFIRIETTFILNGMMYVLRLNLK